MITIFKTLKVNFFKEEIRLDELKKFIEKKIEIDELEKTVLISFLETLKKYPVGFEYEIEDDIVNFSLEESKVKLDINKFDMIKDEIKKKNIFGSKNYKKIYEKQKNKISVLEKKINKYENIKTEFLVTSSLIDKTKIWDKATHIISQANEKLYIMIAFYEQDLAFERLLSEVINREGMETKILYRYGEESNLDFIKNLKNDIEKSAKCSFKPYNLRFLQDRKIEYIGNLHSKMIITEEYTLVGSANLTYHSKLKNEESAILTNRAEIVKNASNHFLDIWGCFHEKEL